MLMPEALGSLHIPVVDIQSVFGRLDATIQAK
jgi:hypothetical protein